MRPQLRTEILELVNRDYFRNFFIVTTGGVRYDITEPNNAAVTRDIFHYYFPKTERAIHVPYDQIATVEEISASKSKR
jgi:hypothetical protein